MCVLVNICGSDEQHQSSRPALNVEIHNTSFLHLKLNTDWLLCHTATECPNRCDSKIHLPPFATGEKVALHSISDTVSHDLLTSRIQECHLFLSKNEAPSDGKDTTPLFWLYRSPQTHHLGVPCSVSAVH